MEYPPLWVWAIVVAIIIGTKLIVRWQATKQIAIQATDRRTVSDKIKDWKLQEKDQNTNTRFKDIKSYKYGPFGLYKGNLAMKSKRREETTT